MVIGKCAGVASGRKRLPQAMTAMRLEGRIHERTQGRFGVLSTETIICSLIGLGDGFLVMR